MAATRVRKQDLGTNVFATPALTLGTVNTAGSAGDAISSDATILAFDTTSPSTQAFGDAAAAGAAAVAARRDHKHAMPANPTPSFATPAITLGTAGAAGAAGTVIRSDGGIAAFDATSPTTQALGDAAVVGAINFAARRDHKHAMPALSSATPIVESGAGAVGTAVPSSREDHVHPAAASAVPTFVFSEVPTGTVNGSNTDFVLTSTPTAGTLRVYKNGIRQKAAAGNDYTLTTATITFLAGNIPQTGDNILCDYHH